jgi:subtilase family serine protease
LTFLVLLASDSSPPQVVSISYGISEFAVERTDAQAFNIEAMKAGLQGITLLVASGDMGSISITSTGLLN